MALIDYIIIILFTLGVLVAGLSFGESGKNMKTFLLVGRGAGWVSGLSLSATFRGTLSLGGPWSHAQLRIHHDPGTMLSGFAIAGFIAASGETRAR